MVNKAMDSYKDSGDIHYRAKAERHAKILAKAIIYPSDSTDYGVNSFFYSAAEGLLAAILEVADKMGGHLNKRCLFLLDEFGTIPPISCAQSLISAGRSRGLNVVASCQSQHQLIRNYTEHGAGNILKNCQVTLSGGFAGIDSSADTISKALDGRTVLTGSVSRNENNPSESLQMTHRDLMTPGELRMMQKGDYVVMQAGHRPFISTLKYYSDWGIRFPEKDFQMPDRSTRQVDYADRRSIMTAIIREHHIMAAPSPAPPEPEPEPEQPHPTHRFVRTE